MISQHLQDKLALLPDQPGCYIMKDENGKILYVGKAKVLKNRVRSYFHGVHDNKTTRLVSHIRDFEFIVTGSEKEALLLEINLIKKHTPPFNIMFMDDKSYPYIVISKDPCFTVRVSRQVKNKKDTYYGPYPSAQSAYEIVRLINQIFPIRKCKNMPKQPCLYYHMHQCLGYCFKEIDNKVNEENRKAIRRFLDGDAKEIIDDLTKQMQQASDELRFERAKEIYDLIQAIEHVIEKQTIDFKEIVITNFSGIYKNQNFYKNYAEEEISWTELSDLSGCNCYCDAEASDRIRKEIQAFTGKGLHFIDSGNYHYMTRLWLEKLQIPFRLLVFDNHTDMQPPAFGGLLSCGGWIAASLEELPLLQEVILVGPDEEAYTQVEPDLQQKVLFLSREKLSTMTAEEKEDELTVTGERGFL